MSPPSGAAVGQVFTPPALADLTLALTIGDLLRRRRILDPACGDGVFLARARAAGLAAPHGIELHAPTAAAARRTVPGAEVLVGDFLAVPPPARDPEHWDAVVGNPPYVRQEALGAARKGEIARVIAADWDAPWPARADLAAAFVARALRFVRPGGRVGFVLSTAALDAGYGEALRHFLRGRARIVAVVVSPRERWFPDAAIHAAIVVLERLGAGPAAAAATATTTSAPALFARLDRPLASAAAEVRSLADLAGVAEVVAVAQAAALGQPWAPLLRAPPVWFQVVAAAGDHLVPLSALAEIRRGVTSGANALFYLPRAGAAARTIEPRFLVPLYKTPRQGVRLRLSPTELDTLAFVCDEPAARLAGFPGASAHVRAHAAVATRPSFAPRPRWWSLPARRAKVFLSKAYDVRFAQAWCSEPIVADQRMYGLTPRPGLAPELLAAALNGTLTALAIESLGRASMGQGALELSVGDARDLPVVDVRRADAAAVAAAFAQVAVRPIGAIWDELERPDRHTLDAALLGAAPARLGELLPSARAALAGAVRDRRTRSAQSG